VSPFRLEVADSGRERKEASVPPRGLPGNANLEQLKNGAKSFRRAVRSGDAGAADVVNEFHPRLASARPGSAELAGFKLADAQLVVARKFDFPSWPKLKAHLELVERYSCSPHDQAIGEAVGGDGRSLADEFLRLACLNYGSDDPVRWQRAAELLEANPHLAHANIYTAAAVGEVAAARELLAADPGCARRPGGPFAWEPLLYLTYSRVLAPAAGRSAVEVARLLLDHGADPNVGYLWEGLVPPFTAVTGVFGHGEQGAPPHPEEAALARLLLERGADPNDDQTLYNRQWSRDDGWLELLFEFGLGTGDGGPWARLLGDRLASPRQMLENELVAAAHHGFADRVRLLLARGVDPAGMGTQHPAHGGRAAIDEAALLGHLEIVDLLAAAGAQASGDAVDRFVSICMAGDRARAVELRSADPTLVERAIARRPDQLIRAAERDSMAAVELLIELGFDVNARSRTAPLHEAAMHGNVEMLRLLLAHGADPNVRDREFGARPEGWAEHHGMTAAQELLAPLTQEP
jgi:hypothetical protein